ncbi:MAG: domain S-box protein [Flavipsychrobacter sp.]|jgi:PAS domain S-box-containing protein|nr:domain S-box protein [Flavipsychrobacter sp.]
MSTAKHILVDFHKVFEASPNLYLLLSPDLTIVGGSDAYMNATLTRRDDIVGRGLFEVFPDNPDDPSADGVSNLTHSLNTVLTRKQPHIMSIQKYDIRNADGVFEERYWSPLNTPVLDERNEVIYIIHRVEDVTELVRAKKALEESERLNKKKIKEGEDRFHKIFNLCPVAIYMTDIKDGSLLYVNKAFEALFQMSIEDAVGKTFVELNITDEQTRANVIKEIEAKGGRAVELEVSLRISNGDMKSMLLSTETVEMDGRKCFLVALVDITERKKMEDEIKRNNQKLRESEEKFQKAFKGSAAGITITRLSDNVYLDANDAYCEMTGYSRKELLGRTSLDLNIVADPGDREDALKVVRDTGSIRHYEITLRHKSGRLVSILFSMDTILLNGEKYAIGVSYDITKRKKAEADLTAVNRELEAFTYSVSHDLRAPLRAVTGFARILEEDYTHVLDDEGKRLLTTISNNAERMGVLIDDLLSFSRLGRKDLQKAEVDMNELVKSVVAEVNKTARSNAVINAGELPRVRCDAALIKQVLINLVSNALKYSSKKEHAIIEISSVLSGNEIIFSIKDNGVGFDMRYVDKLFGVFQRLHSNSEFPGTGVGLAIVQRIIHKHDGRVWAEGNVNEGAQFYFTLPVLIH